MLVAIDSIQIAPRLRNVGPAAVTTLAESMSRLGQLQPISVCYEGTNSSFTLVAGLHRLAAAKRLRWKEIEAIVVNGNELDHRLREIAENLHRADLSKLERDEQVAEWIKITERTQSRQDVANESKREDGRGHRPEGGVAAAARELGVHEKEAERAVKVASLSDDAKEAARESGLDNNRSALLEAARETEPEKQVAKISAIAKGSRLSERKFARAARDSETRKFAAWIIARSKPGDIAKIANWLKYTKADEVLAVIREMQQ
ncbi:ParB/RepB/Spo0J family partition protein [Bradyrhizobium sp. BWC-3-1]|uniref:ParB/RepB/Spo0J family partition protein n=1 Tax=Bradyrhizobium sp. BWC-3-1 TaxID=3080012 RepID=UPI00293F62A1|nr:ParB N-terminal domain-containing protein [Bradyrhizobium sp. BWC-3-1]WOH55137.1 ParB N-terminal domain-containing protein [Bradyrhizobium sp. BWC-3-1]